MTFDERVEAMLAVQGVDELSVGSPQEAAAALIRAAFPDLYGEKPTAWIAPWEADERMQEIGWGDVRKDWRAMRDHHLKQRT